MKAPILILFALLQHLTLSACGSADSVSNPLSNEFRPLSHYAHPDGRVCISYGYTETSNEIFGYTGDFRTIQLHTDIEKTGHSAINCATVSIDDQTRVGFAITAQHIVVAREDVAKWFSSISADEWESDLRFKEIPCRILRIESSDLMSMDFLWGIEEYTLQLTFRHPCISNASRGRLIFDLKYNMLEREVSGYSINETIQ